MDEKNEFGDRLFCNIEIFIDIFERNCKERKKEGEKRFIWKISIDMEEIKILSIPYLFRIIIYLIVIHKNLRLSVPKIYFPSISAN